MTKQEAHKLLDKQKVNEPVPQFLINHALQSTGDLSGNFAMEFKDGIASWMEGIHLEQHTRN
jgi:hypothetical protein